MRPNHASLSLLVLLLSTAVGFSNSTIDLIAITGDPSPDGNGTLAQFTKPSLNDAGQTGFLSQLDATTGGAFDNLAVYRGTSGNLTQIARSGQSVIGGDTIIGFNTFGTGINEHGDVIETLHIDSGEAFPELVTFIGDGGPLDLFPRIGSPSPSGNNVLFAMSTASITDSGVSAYIGTYPGANPERGIYRRNSDGSITTLVLESAPAPRGGTFDQISLSSPAINNAGQVALTARVNDNADTFQTVLRVDGTTISELVRAGDTLADGITTIESITFTTRTPINNSGQIAFAADYSQPGTSPEGVFLADQSGVTLMAGRLLPGGNSAIDEARVFDINDEGQIGLITGFNAGNDEALYIIDDTGPTLVAKEGNPAPNNRFFTRIFENSLSMNEQGQIAFLSEVSDTVDGASTGRGLYLYDPQAGVQQAVFTGDSLDTGTVSTILANGTMALAGDSPMSDGFSGLNNRGEIAFFFLLDDLRSGIAVWSPVLDGDLDGDGFVGINDLSIVLTSWNQNIPPADPLADPSGDGFVGIDDLNFVLTNWNAGTPPASTNSIPEPATVLCLIFTCFGLSHSRGRTA